MDQKSECNQGVLFGGDCERRIFYPTTPHKVHVDLEGGRQRSANPLATLRLTPSSPYAGLRTAATVSTTNEHGEVVSRSKFRDHQEEQRSTELYACQQKTAAELSPGRSTSLRGRVSTSPPRKHINSSAQQTKDGGVFASQWSDRYGVAGRSHNRRILSDNNLSISSHCEKDNNNRSINTQLERMRIAEKVTGAEAIRLRREADSSVLIRRFLRCSGLPLDHIFAASVRIYTRSRLRSGFSKWRIFSATETQRHHHHMKAVAALQASLRLSIAHRTTTQHRLEHGPATRRSCGVIQNACRKHLVRRSVLARITRIDQHELEESNKKEQEVDALEAESRRRSEACKMIQTAWRGAIGRSVGTTRARRELKAILLDLGGGLGRMHRTQDCRAVAACLEHLVLAEASAVVLQEPQRSSRNSREVLGLLLRCRGLLRSRQKLREDMRNTWARQARAREIARVERDRARETSILQHLRERQTGMERIQAAASELQERQIAECIKIYETKLKASQERQRLLIDATDAERRQRDEVYLMWREEVRQNEIAREITCRRERREMQEMVMMRREDLLTRKAWTLSDCTTRHKAKLQEHKIRIAELSLCRKSCSQSPGNPSHDKTLPFLRALGSKPAAVVMERASCVVGGRKVQATVVIQPSDACMSGVQQAAAARSALRIHDEARKQVAHWGGRCRVDAEHAARVRDEQFRLRCKTKWERRRKAAEVAAANALVEESVVRLRAALEDVRHATVARALTLADALGVEPPWTLLSRHEKDEYSYPENISKQEVNVMTAGARGTKDSMPTLGYTILAPDTREGVVEATSHQNGLFWSENGNSECSCAKHVESSGTVSPHDGKAPRDRALTTRDRVRRLGSPCQGQGWNREWSRSVDTWCREECIRFRERVAPEIVGAADWLHWLRWSAGCRCSFAGECNIPHSAPGATEGRDTGGGAGEGWDALRKFEDVVDLLELVRSTFEMVVLVEGFPKPQNCHRAEEEPQALSSVFKSRVDKWAPKTVLRASASQGITTAPATDPGGRSRGLLNQDPSPSLGAESRNSERSKHVQEGDGMSRYVTSLSPLTILHSIDEESVLEMSSEDEKGMRIGLESSTDLQPHRGAHYSLEISNGTRLKASVVAAASCGDDLEEERCQHTSSRHGIDGHFARLVLDPSAIEKTLGVRPLSAFALQAARQQGNPLPSSLCRASPMFAATAECSSKTTTVPLSTRERNTQDGQLSMPSDDYTKAFSFGPAALKHPTKQPYISHFLSFGISTAEELLSDREKHGLVCVVESFVLPKLRVGVPRNGRTRTARHHGGGCLPHLRLELAEVREAIFRRQRDQVLAAGDDAEDQKALACSSVNSLSCGSCGRGGDRVARTERESPCSRGDTTSGPLLPVCDP